MRLTNEQISTYHTMKDTYLVQVPRIKRIHVDTAEPHTAVTFSMAESTDKEVTEGTIIASPDGKLDGKHMIFNPDNTIELGSFMELDDMDDFEYRLVRLANTILISKEDEGNTKCCTSESKE